MKVFFVLPTVIIAVCAILLLYATFSIWFLYGLAEGDSFHAVLAVRRDKSIQSLLAESEARLLATQLGFDTSSFSRYVAGKRGSMYEMVAIPFIKEQTSIVRKLETGGWEVKRLGWLVHAQKHTGPVSSHVRGDVSVTRQIVRGYQSFFKHSISAEGRALALIRLESRSYPFIDGLYTVVVMPEKEGASAHIVFGNSEFTVHPRMLVTDNGMNTYDILFVSKQSNLFSSAPQALREQIERRLQDAFGLTKTRSPLMESMLGSNSLAIIDDESGTAMGVAGSQDEVEAFADSIEDWFAAQRAYENPVRKAFRLPDGTIGFEYVPGESQTPFARASLGGDCQTADAADDLTMWLCRGEGAVVSGTSHEVVVAVQNAFRQENNWHLLWQKNDVQPDIFGSLKIKWIEATGNEKQAQIYFQFEL